MDRRRINNIYIYYFKKKIELNIKKMINIPINYINFLKGLRLDNVLLSIKIKGEFMHGEMLDAIFFNVLPMDIVELVSYALLREIDFIDVCLGIAVIVGLFAVSYYEDNKDKENKKKAKEKEKK